MFWNGKDKEYNKIEEFVEPKKNYSEILDEAVSEIQNIREFYRDPKNWGERYLNGWDFRFGMIDPRLKKIVNYYYSVASSGSSLVKENDELRKVVNGNKEYYADYQETLNKTREELEKTKLHLELEQKAYQKIYMEKREAESEVYSLKRELELRGLGWTDKQILENKE
jgi:hypothetical protein